MAKQKKCSRDGRTVYEKKYVNTKNAKLIINKIKELAKILVELDQTPSALMFTIDKYTMIINVKEVSKKEYPLKEFSANIRESGLELRLDVKEYLIGRDMKEG